MNEQEPWAKTNHDIWCENSFPPPLVTFDEILGGRIYFHTRVDDLILISWTSESLTEFPQGKPHSHNFALISSSPLSFLYISNLTSRFIHQRRNKLASRTPREAFSRCAKSPGNSNSNQPSLINFTPANDELTDPQIDRVLKSAVQNLPLPPPYFICHHDNSSPLQLKKLHNKKRAVKARRPSAKNATVWSRINPQNAPIRQPCLGKSLIGRSILRS